MAGSRTSRRRRISAISVPVLAAAALGLSMTQTAAHADPGASA
ncbi:hypothetical protein [Terrabacter aerolatus]|nr:hypothetical protein [Terrabacter aerolatus]